MYCSILNITSHLNSTNDGIECTGVVGVQNWESRYGGGGGGEAVGVPRVACQI